MKENNLTKIKITSNNPNIIINRLISKNINLVKLNKSGVKEIDCFVNDNDLKKIKALDLHDCDLHIEKIGGIKKLKNTLLARCGLLIGLAVSIIFMFVINNRLLNIEISGLYNIPKSEVVNSIGEFGLKTFSKMNFDEDKLENFLIEKHNFMLVSIGTKGNTLIINVKENDTNEINNYLEITAPYNMVIKSINVYAGSTDLKVGDVVYKGDVLVYPYDVIDNEKINVKPCAEIEADVFIGKSYTFYNEEIVKLRTGRSKCISIDYTLGNIKLFSNNYKNDYSLYEVEERENFLTTNFLPIKMKKTIVYELEEKIVKKEFEVEKETIIQDLKNSTYNEIGKNLVVDDEIINISQIENGYIVNLYLKSTISLNYKD